MLRRKQSTIENKQSQIQAYRHVIYLKIISAHTCACVLVKKERKEKRKKRQNNICGCGAVVTSRATTVNVYGSW